MIDAAIAAERRVRVRRLWCARETIMLPLSLLKMGKNREKGEGNREQGAGVLGIDAGYRV